LHILPAANLLPRIQLWIGRDVCGWHTEVDDAGELLVWVRFGTFVPGDQEDEIARKVTSGTADWMFRNLSEFPCSIKSIRWLFAYSISHVGAMWADVKNKSVRTFIDRLANKENNPEISCCWWNSVVPVLNCTMWQKLE